MNVAICEQGVFGGTCLNVGCIPTKMFVYTAEVAASCQRVRRNSASTPRVDDVRWPDIVVPDLRPHRSVVAGGENYRRSSPKVTVYARHTRFGPSRDGRHTLRVDGGDEFTADKVVIAAGSRAAVPQADRRVRRAVLHQRHDHADRRAATSIW